VTYTPSPVGSTETQTITATYGGDATHLGSRGTTTILVLALAGRVTGGGQVDLDGGGRASFGFVVQRKTTGGLATGQLEYHNHVTGMNVHSTGMLTLLIVENTATFTGTCRVNTTTACTFSVTVQDNGEPGSQGPNKDKVSITVMVATSPPQVEEVTLRDLRSGNIKIHRDATFESGAVATGAGEGIFPAGASFNGVPVNGLQFGKGVGIREDSTAIGDFQALLLGTSLLGQPQNINVAGLARNGAVNPDGSATFSGLCAVDMGDGTPPLTGVPFSVTATTEGLRLILGNTPLPMATLTAGSITIE
jgi:hypothetical protein